MKKKTARAYALEKLESYAYMTLLGRKIENLSQPMQVKLKKLHNHCPLCELFIVDNPQDGKSCGECPLTYPSCNDHSNYGLRNNIALLRAWKPVDYKRRGEKIMTGVELIAKERKRQIEEEGWTAEHDDEEHDEGILALAASCYALSSQRTAIIGNDAVTIDLIKLLWPWDWKWWKPTPDDRIKELKKAGALIAAEIDRLLRFAKKEAKNKNDSTGT